MHISEQFKPHPTEENSVASNSPKRQSRGVLKTARRVDGKQQFVWKTGKSILSTTDGDRHPSKISERFEFRLKQFNDALNLLRQQVVTSLIENEHVIWPPTELKQIVLIGGDDVNFMHQLDQFPEVRTLVLPWLVPERQAWVDRVNECSAVA